jgi:hypothetical protein
MAMHLKLLLQKTQTLLQQMLMLQASRQAVLSWLPSLLSQPSKLTRMQLLRTAAGLKMEWLASMMRVMVAMLGMRMMESMRSMGVLRSRGSSSRSSSGGGSLQGAAACWVLVRIG